MTKEEFYSKYRGEKVAVHCDTEEKAKAYFALEDSLGTVWGSGCKLDETDWDCYKKETCYALFKDGTMGYSPLGWFKSEGYKIVEFELDEPKETFKVGDVVYAKKNGVELKVTETDLYRLETKDGTAWFMKKELLTKTKPKRLQKITREELADMGYVLVK